MRDRSDHDEAELSKTDRHADEDQGPRGSDPARVRVLVVDDSALMRRLLCDLLGASPEIEVVGTARDGREAVFQAVRLKPDVITLDVEMPEVSGLEALPLLLAAHEAPGDHGQRADPGRCGCHAPGAGTRSGGLHAQARAQPACRDARQLGPARCQGSDRRPEPCPAASPHHAVLQLGEQRDDSSTRENANHPGLADPAPACSRRTSSRQARRNPDGRYFSFGVWSRPVS